MDEERISQRVLYVTVALSAVVFQGSAADRCPARLHGYSARLGRPCVGRGCRVWRAESEQP